MARTMATIQLRWADGATGVSFCCAAKTEVHVEPGIFAWVDSQNEWRDLRIAAGGYVVISASEAAL